MFGVVLLYYKVTHTTKYTARKLHSEIGIRPIPNGRNITNQNDTRARPFKMDENVNIIHKRLIDARILSFRNFEPLHIHIITENNFTGV